MKRLIIYITIGIFSVIIVNNRFSSQYLAQMKNEIVAVTKDNHDLYEKIVNARKQYSKPAVDARIDPVWKAIPGINGIEVDVDASYKKMQEKGKFDEALLVYKQKSPKIHLSDLPPAPIYRGNPEKPMVAFIINVAWGNEYLPSMLQTLKKHNITTSFFLEGRWVKENPDLAKMISDSGHEIGNHSYTHPDMMKLSAEEIRKQLEKTNEVIEATVGVRCKWFGPPSGSYRDEVVEIADQLGLGTILWSVDTIDWQKPSPEKIIYRVETKVHEGALILMHPTESTTKALDRLIETIKRQNYQISTVSNTLSEERIE